ncbi:hypothetical protein Godav_026101 [Gossypium davidsonii]|uniref:RNase H type-1 domain-containing protein n=2 Tax=Gossypium TaxID=3633 RepID=A0A7J8T8M6_GOSDV|nr:hypothetical protein [Gossypium davidsonii]MBA0661572.1 hypothetical protein [Gossypium klotzschianum]
MGYLKFNVDGSSSGNPRRAGYGGILKGDTGKLIAILSGPLKNSDSDLTELTAIRIALEVFVKSEWENNRDLALETDSMVIISWCFNPVLRQWRFAETFKIIDHCIILVQDVKIVYVCREVNNCAKTSKSSMLLA